jgi:cytochrome c peroxidase
LRHALAWVLLGSFIVPAHSAAVADPIAPVPDPAPANPARLQLGERLFRDMRLSGDGRRACASCHDLDANGADRKGISAGASGQPIDYNTPTVFNAALSFRLGWRGNFRTVEELTEAVVLDPRLMAATWDGVTARLRAEADYRAAFKTAYGRGPGREEILDALSVFLRSLLTPNAPFDRYLRGDQAALTAEQIRGWDLFRDYGCVACHQGVNVGGNLFQRFGIFADRPIVSQADLGRFTVTGLERDRRVFRVPSLRNVAVTAPYFHDGSAATLADAVRTMARSQLGRTLDDGEADAIAEFLRSLTGARVRAAP